jgi:protein O-mannosyl-transferase
MTERARRWWWDTAAIALLAIASSAIGVLNNFAYDDRYIVEQNPTTLDLRHWWNVFASSYWPRKLGGDGYRPLTMLFYRIEWALGRGRPWIFHATNILLYALSAVLVYFIARRMLPRWAAWVTAALFAVHPVHVEAVAGVVGLSEQLVAVTFLLALLMYLRDRMSGELRPRTAVGIALIYAVSCFSKEHAIVLPAILAAAELLVIEDPRPVADRVRRLRPTYLALIMVAVAFVWVRSLVLSDHGIGGFAPFTPFSTLHISNVNRALTALGVVPQWVRLLYWPAHLSAEYGPPDIQIAQGLGLWQLPGFLLLAAILSLGVVLWRRQRVISFGIVIVCITLAPSSNFLIPAGIVLAERTLFLPSLGAMLIVGGLLTTIAPRLRARGQLTPRVLQLAGGLLAIVLLAGVVRSAERTTVWRDNQTLFDHMIADAPQTYRAHYMLGAWNFEHKRLRVGEEEYKTALRLFPYDPYLSYNLAEQYRSLNLCGPAIPLYEWTHTLDPNFPLGHAAYAWCLLNEDHYDEAKVQAMAAIRRGGNLPLMHRILFIADSVKAAGTSPRPRAVAGARSNSKVPDSVQNTGRRGAVPPPR